MSPNKVNPLHLIQAKLYQPQAGPDLVARPQLLARLDAGLCHKLILVSAPAGFGKTTLVSQWLAASPHTAAWVALDEDDNQLPRFLRYICAAVQGALPGTCATLQALLAGIELPSVEALAKLLVAELDALPAELILVLDDYHCIHARDVHHVLRQLLHRLPPRLHLVILTPRRPAAGAGAAACRAAADRDPRRRPALCPRPKRASCCRAAAARRWTRR